MNEEIIINDFEEENDKKLFAASIFRSLNNLLNKNVPMVIKIDPEVSINNVGDNLRSIADIVDCAKDIIKGKDTAEDDDDDDGDFWKK